MESGVPDDLPEYMVELEDKAKVYNVLVSVKWKQAIFDLTESFL